MKKIKNCPFCGREAKICVYSSNYCSIVYLIECTNKKCNCKTGEKTTQKSAISCWNKRYTSNGKYKMKDLTDKIMSLLIGSPPPYMPQIPIIDILLEEYTEKTLDKELKRRRRLHKKSWKEHRIQRKKELKELAILLKPGDK